MEFLAYSAQPSTPPPLDAAEGLNTAGWGPLLWVAVIALVAAVLLAAAGLGLVSRGTRTRD